VPAAAGPQAPASDMKRDTGLWKRDGRRQQWIGLPVGPTRTPGESAALGKFTGMRFLPEVGGQSGTGFYRGIPFAWSGLRCYAQFMLHASIPSLQPNLLYQW
jgi:hypothetical protein